MKFADVTNDVAFRKIFGNENRKECLISFLNAILQLEEDDRIKKVSILTPYQLPKLRGGKVTIIDVRATDQKNRTFIVEMQVADLEGFDKSVLYYASKSYSDQIKRGDLYRHLRPVFFIGVLDFKFTKNKNYISRNQVKDIETGERTIKDVEFTFIELPKFKKKVDQLTTLTEKWVFFIKNAENLEVVPDNVDDAGLKSAYEEANQYTWTKEELHAYDYVFMREEDDRARFDKMMNTAKAKAMEEGLQKGIEQGIQKGIEEGLQKGIEQGIQKGIEKGIEQGKQEIQQGLVLNLHKMGISAEKIAEAVAISVETVLEILKHQPD